MLLVWINFDTVLLGSNAISRAIAALGAFV